jgi:hypothetical protein
VNTLRIFPLILCIAGCSVLNFSANYYTPPENYKNELVNLWTDLIAQIDLKRTYRLDIIEGEMADKLNGVPSISANTVLLPNDFIKYVYQNYYKDRYFIIGTVIVHELMHTEISLPSKPPEEHVKTDIAAIKILGENKNLVEDYYRALDVMRNYWFARKGVGGHAANVGWNVANVAALLYVGSGYFRDWYATDLKVRMKMIKKHYDIHVYKTFERSSAPGSL